MKKKEMRFAHLFLFYINFLEKIIRDCGYCDDGLYSPYMRSS